MDSPPTAKSAAQTIENVRLLIVVEENDYREHLADIFLPEMMPERIAQRVSNADAHILNSATAWSQQVQEVAIFSTYSEEVYSEVCYLGMRLMGSGVRRTRKTGSGRRFEQNRRAPITLVADFCPTHIVMTTPSYPLLSWANRNHISSLLLLADWQEPLNPEEHAQHRRLIRQINRPDVEWVGAHGVLACQVMSLSGVAATKLIPWEWPRPQPSRQYPPKTLDSGDADLPEKRHIRLIYVGALAASSRVDDLLTAVNHLQQRAHPVTLQIFGDRSTSEAELDRLHLKSVQLGIADSIHYSIVEEQLAAADQILSQVRAADLVVIPGYTPSVQHPGGSSPVLVQMAGAACTPIVACDHASLKDHLFHGVNAMIFPEGNEKSMVHRIERLMGQPQLYAQLSESSGVSPRLGPEPAIWSVLVDRWIRSGAANQQWLRNYALSSGRY